MAQTPQTTVPPVVLAVMLASRALADERAWAPPVTADAAASAKQRLLELLAQIDADDPDDADDADDADGGGDDDDEDDEEEEEKGERSLQRCSNGGCVYSERWAWPVFQTRRRWRHVRRGKTARARASARLLRPRPFPSGSDLAVRGGAPGGSCWASLGTTAGAGGKVAGGGGSGDGVLSKDTSWSCYHHHHCRRHCHGECRRCHTTVVAAAGGGAMARRRGGSGARVRRLLPHHLRCSAHFHRGALLLGTRGDDQGALRRGGDQGGR